MVVKSIMKYTALLLLLFSCSTNKNLPIEPSDTSQYWPGSDNKAYVSCCIEEILWKDSTKVNFLAININGLTEIQDENFYCWYSGPIKVYNRKKNCCVTSVFTRNHTGYFLVDDFKRNTDSLTITISGRHGEQMKNMSYTQTKVFHIHKDNIHLDSLLSLPLKSPANRKWYTNWKKENPQHQDERMKEMENECN